MESSESPKLFRPVRAISIALLFIILADIVMGVYLAIVGLTNQQFETISSPRTLSELQSFSLFFRFINSINDLAPQWMITIVFFIIPVVAIFACWTYFILKRRYGRGRGVFSRMVLSATTIVLAVGAAAFLIPGPIEWGVFRIAAEVNASKGIELVSKDLASITTDTDEVIEKVSAAPRINIYADYGSGGAILAALIGDSKKEKLTYFQSFYLPIFFSKHKTNTGQADVDRAELILVDGDSLVFGNKVSKETLEKILPVLGDKFLRNSYPKQLSKSTAQLKNFAIIDDSLYNEYFYKKSTADLKKIISNNEYAFNMNKVAIDSYPAVVSANDARYKKFVTDQEVEYQNNCVKQVTYSDCVNLRQIIDKNKVTIDQDRRNVLAEYNRAIQYNKAIQSNLNEEKKQLDSFASNDNNSLENNKGEYSVGVTFGDDTIYLRYFKDTPVSGESLRIIVHEMLHMYSHSNSKFLPQPFDEGVTDYLATRALGYGELDSIRASGYPLEVQVVIALLEKIPEDEFLDVYFNKDETKLKTLMKKYFPDTSYAEFMAKYDAIFDETYHINGTSHSFGRGLIDHKDVVSVRQLLGLKEKKFQYVVY